MEEGRRRGERERKRRGGGGVKETLYEKLRLKKPYTRT